MPGLPDATKLSAGDHLAAETPGDPAEIPAEEIPKAGEQVLVASSCKTARAAGITTERRAYAQPNQPTVTGDFGRVELHISNIAQRFLKRFDTPPLAVPKPVAVALQAFVSSCVIANRDNPSVSSALNIRFSLTETPSRCWLKCSL